MEEEQDSFGSKILLGFVRVVGDGVQYFVLEGFLVEGRWGSVSR